MFASDRDGNFDLYAIRTECAIGLSLEEPATCEAIVWLVYLMFGIVKRV